MQPPVPVLALARARSIALVLNVLCIVFFAMPQSPIPSVVLFQNVRIFHGKSAMLSAPSHVLGRGNKVEKISTAAISVEPRPGTIIDGGGRVLMPGLIDAH
jgi:hypothetical protein